MKRRLILAAAGVVLGLLAVFLWSLTPQTLPVSKTLGATLPSLTAKTASIAVVETATIDTRAILAYRGGSFEKLLFGVDVFVVRHPKGTLLVEAGVGRQVAKHYEFAYWRQRALSHLEPAQVPLVDQLGQAGLAPGQLRGVYLTHAHWDHVGALADMPGVPVFVTRAERDFIEHGGFATALIRSFGALNYRLIDFEGPAYGGFRASHDVFGDGSVVVVPAGGHTPGSVVIFVRTAERDYALIGDLAWQQEGVKMPAEKPWISRDMVDHDAEGVRSNLVALHQLQQANPGLLMVPSHDRRVTSTLPRLAKATGSPP